MAFQFKKEWSDLEVGLKIREAFQDIIPRLVDFEILQSVHTKLLRPTLAQGQYLTGAMIHRIFRDKPIYVRPTQQILKLPKQRKTQDDLDGQVDFDNEFEVTNDNSGNLTNGNLGLLSSTRATGEKAADTVNFPSVPNSCSDNNATDAMGSGLPSTSGSAPTSYDEMNAITNSSEQYQQPLPNAYDNYIDALYESSPDEDADLLAAIYASIADQKRSSVPSGEKEVDVVIRKFINDNLQPASEEEYCNILINRKNLLSSTLAAIQRSTFSFVKPVHVSFSGEEAADAGGPRREYFRLLMSSLKNLGIFQGSCFSHDLHLLRCKKYELGGKLVSWSVLQGGSGPNCLSQG